VQPQAGPISPDGYWMWNGTQWVPNPYRPAMYVPPALPFESAQFRASMATLFIAINIVAVLLFVVFDALDMIHVGQGSPRDALYLAAGFVAILAFMAYYGSFIPGVVFFSMWLHRVVRNMPSLGAVDPRWTPGGAVGRCFIPFLNLVHPLLSVLDAWRGSWPERRWVDAGMRRTIGAPILVVCWWTSWLLGRFLNVLGGFLQQVNDVTTKLTGLAIDVVSQLLMMSAAVLVILLVRRLTNRQEYKNELIASGRLV
jgi:hypothetical protein